MSSLGTCLEPQCQECRENEYQDKYTRESKCQLQPYCDRSKTNSAKLLFSCRVIDVCLGFQHRVQLVTVLLPDTNFQAADHDTKKRTTCICKVGFHCSGEECMICVPHSTCGPGHGVHSKGATHLSDPLNVLNLD